MKNLGDPELLGLLEETIADSERESQIGSLSRRGYYREVAGILKAILDE